MNHLRKTARSKDTSTLGTSSILLNTLTRQNQNLKSPADLKPKAPATIQWRGPFFIDPCNFKLPLTKEPHEYRKFRQQPKPKPRYHSSQTNGNPNYFAPINPNDCNWNCNQDQGHQNLKPIRKTKIYFLINENPEKAAIKPMAAFSNNSNIFLAISHKNTIKVFLKSADGNRTNTLITFSL